MPEPSFDCPVLDLDPFSTEFLSDPYPFHEQLRESGPVVWLARYGIVAMARYAEVRDALQDWKTYCSSRGGGLTDFAREKPWRPPSIVLEADPPLHSSDTRCAREGPRAWTTGAAPCTRSSARPTSSCGTSSPAARSTPSGSSPKPFRSGCSRTRSDCGRTAARTCCPTGTWPSTLLGPATTCSRRRSRMLRRSSAGSRPNVGARRSRPRASARRSTRPWPRGRSARRKPGCSCARFSRRAWTRPSSAWARRSGASPASRSSGRRCGPTRARHASPSRK